MYKRANIMKDSSQGRLDKKRQNGGYECGKYQDPALEYRHCGGYETEVALPKEDPYTYLSHGRSELKTHWENPAFPARGGSQSAGRLVGGSRRKQRGGELEYPFESQQNEFALPPKVLGEVTSNINTNFVSNNDLYGCLEQQGGSRKVKVQRGGDCGCASGPIMLGGSQSAKRLVGGSQSAGRLVGGSQRKKKQTGRGYGYEMNIQGAITNRPEVLRYSTEGTGYSLQRGGSQSAKRLVGGSQSAKRLVGGSQSAKRLVGGSQSAKRLVGGSQSAKRLVGGSAASDNLMDYFLNFQTRCRGTEIY
jgi:hypothetical protein